MNKQNVLRSEPAEQLFEIISPVSISNAGKCLTLGVSTELLLLTAFIESFSVIQAAVEVTLSLAWASAPVREIPSCACTPISTIT